MLVFRRTLFFELNVSVAEEVMLWLADLKGENRNGKAEGK